MSKDKKQKDYPSVALPIPAVLRDNGELSSVASWLAQSTTDFSHPHRFMGHYSAFQPRQYISEMDRRQKADIHREFTSLHSLLYEGSLPHPIYEPTNYPLRGHLSLPRRVQGVSNTASTAYAREAIRKFRVQQATQEKAKARILAQPPHQIRDILQKTQTSLGKRTRSGSELSDNEDDEQYMQHHEDIQDEESDDSEYEYVYEYVDEDDNEADMVINSQTSSSTKDDGDAEIDTELAENFASTRRAEAEEREGIIALDGEARDYFNSIVSPALPDKEFIKRRICQAALINGIGHINEGVVDLLAAATEVHITNIIRALTKRDSSLEASINSVPNQTVDESQATVLLVQPTPLERSISNSNGYAPAQQPLPLVQTIQSQTQGPSQHATISTALPTSTQQVATDHMEATSDGASKATTTTTTSTSTTTATSTDNNDKMDTTDSVSSSASVSVISSSSSNVKQEAGISQSTELSASDLLTAIAGKKVPSRFIKSEDQDLDEKKDDSSRRPATTSTSVTSSSSSSSSASSTKSSPDDDQRPLEKVRLIQVKDLYEVAQQQPELFAEDLPLLLEKLVNMHA